MSRPMQWAGGVFAPAHAALMGSVVLPPLNRADFAPELLVQAQRTWAQRTRTEFRSVQIMTRFLTEVVGAGDPIDVYAGVVDLIADEVRHVALCASLTRALGAQPTLPEPVRLQDPPQFLKASMGERALHTGIAMVLINETLSVAFIGDLAARCQHPAVQHVLNATLADEDGHEAFGLAYVRASLGRFPESTLPAWRGLVTETLSGHRAAATRALADVPADRQTLAAWPDQDRANLGLFSPARQALVFRAAEARLLATLRDLKLAD